MAKRRKIRDFPSVADEVLLVPQRAIAGPAPAMPNRSRKSKKGPMPKKRTPYEIDIGSLEPFGGREDLMVRTALVRPRNYSPRKAPYLDSPGKTAALCMHMIDYDDEYYVVISLSARNQVRAIYEAAKGGGSSAAVDLRSILKIPLLTGGAGVVTVHNHPSGEPYPSHEDVVMHERVKEGLQCVGAPLLDYVIVARDGYYSSLDERVTSWAGGL
jgi:DNA repair protein RadC